MGLLSQWVESLDYQYEILSTCTRYISPRSHCEKCVQSCPENAISLQQNKPRIDQKKCLECGKCISACPVQAVAGIYPNRTIIQNQLVVKDEVAPTEKELLILYKKGIKAIISESPELLTSWIETIDQVNATLYLLNEVPFSTEVKSIQEDEVFSRRELFSFWKTKGELAVKQVAPAKWRFNQNDFHLPKYYGDYQFADITIDVEKCTLCTACQKLCHNHCFHIGEEQFIVSAQNCSSCQLCVDACPKGAITVAEHIEKAEKDNHPIYLKTCHSCDKLFNTLQENNETCVACRMRKSFLND